MQKDDITELVQIPGFSVADITFRERKGQVPEVRIRLTRDKPWFCCSGCGQYYLTYYDCDSYELRDLPYGKWKKASLLFDKVRVKCSRCGVKVERLEWLEPYARLTKRFEKEVARECRLIQSINGTALGQTTFFIHLYLLDLPDAFIWKSFLSLRAISFINLSSQSYETMT